MKNPREQRQSEYYYFMSLRRAYLRLAHVWHRSPKYSIDERYAMCLAADAMAAALGEKAAGLWD